VTLLMVWAARLEDLRNRETLADLESAPLCLGVRIHHAVPTTTRTPDGGVRRY